MKTTLLLLLFLSAACPGCKKAAENLLEDAILKSITDGEWVITSFTENGIAKTADFTDYSFRYHTDKTVDAMRNGVIERTGNWDGDPGDKTTWAEFPGATLPLTSLNGTWKISNNTWTYVIASQVSDSITKTFRLEKH